jgi:thiol-disulfide isomerase/thioredoxin
MSRKQYVISIIFALLVLGFLGILTIYSTSLGDRTGSEGVNSQSSGYELELNLAYDFKGTTNTGELISLAQYKGSVVLLDFWSSWCAPCKKEAKGLNDLYMEYSKQNYDVEFIGINIWDTTNDFVTHLDKFGVEYTNVLDDNGSVLFEYGVRGIPEKYLIDAQGRLVWKFVGPTESDVLKNKIDALLTEY